ncbi:MAG: ABC transporter ATP-binding protein [Dehalococcoidia bacterium]|nr:MAG: ABC transporter ATP-binding protein [Dehalococcoidia bacterium]
MNSQFVIETQNLKKAYGKFVAVDGINLQIAEGEVYGFLGPNGAGKTTTILMLMGFCEPSTGLVRITGYDPAREPIKVKKVVGYMPEKIGFYDDLTARENLEYTGRLNGFYGKVLTDKINDLLNDVGLADKANQLVGKFSHGMKQRLGIADVMIKEPKIAIFDEPTSGIDPEGTEHVLNLIKSMALRKVTIVISSHQLHQVQKICTQVGIFTKGKIVASGPVDKLGREALRKGKFNIILPIAQLTEQVRDEIKKIPEVIIVESDGNSTVVTADENISKQLEEVVLKATGLKLQMKVEEFELEEVYMKYFEE